MPPDPSTDDLRRRDDVMAAELDKRLALVEQAQHLEQRAAEARWKSLENLIGALTTKVDGYAATLNTAIAEPAASPGGRQLLEDLDEIRDNVKANGKDIDGLQEFRTEVRAAIRVLKAVVSISAVVSGFAGAVQALHLLGH